LVTDWKKYVVKKRIEQKKVGKKGVYLVDVMNIHECRHADTQTKLETAK
jgi:hypothetical protein